MTTIFKFKVIVIGLVFVCVQLQAQTAGILLGSDTVCAGNNIGNLTFSGSAGNIIQWEFAYSSGGPWIPIVNTSPNYVYQNLLQTVFFRVVTQIGFLPLLYSNVAQVTCQSPPPAFTINAPTLQCVQGLSTASLTQQSNSGAYWEYSPNNWASSTPLGGTPSNTIAMPIGGQAYKLRAYTYNYACPSVYSNVLDITPAQLSNAGVISGTTQLCSGANICTLTVANTIGTIVAWESSFAPAGPYAPIGGSASLSSLPLANLIQTSYYRTKTQNGNCPIATSQSHSLQIDQASVGGFVSGSYSICAGNNPASLILQGFTGTVNQWQRLNGVIWQSLAATTNSVIVVTPSATANFRAIVQNGVCPPAVSNTHTLTVYPKPFVSFSGNTVCVQNPSIFNNQSTGSFITNWNFGDGSSSSVYAPSHTYTNAGNYTVKLKCISAFGCIDSSSANSVVHPVPLASFLNSDSLCDGSTFNFFNNSTISSGSITTVAYSFGDGSGTTNANANHTFSSSGTFQVTQTVSSNFGCANAKSKSIQVLPKPSVNFSISNACKHQNISLHNLSGITNGYLFYKWYFGNGDSSSVFEPNYAYQQSGTYFIQLKASSNYNCQSTITKPLQVHPVPAITLPNYSICANTGISLQASISTTASIASVNFSFGDGSVSSSYQNLHTYFVAGIYPLSITVVTDSNCFASANSQVRVHPKPKVDFLTTDGCENETIEITNLSTVSSGSLTFSWLLNADQIFNQVTPTLPPLPAGTHTLTLSVTSNLGCKDSSTAHILIYPIPNCKIAEISPCQNSTRLISLASSISTGQIKNYTWLRNSGYLSNAQQFLLNFTKSGNELLEVICESEKGCKNSDSLTIKIAPIALASFSTSLACSNNAVHFTNTSTSNAFTFNSKWRVNDSVVETLHLSKSNLKPGYHNVRLITTTEKGCRDSIQQSIQVAAAPELLITADTVFNLGEQKYLSVQGASSYTWYPSSYLSNAFADNVLCTPTTNITYTLFAQSPHGCESTAIVPIRIKKDYVLEVFNVITLNGNALNNHFHINNIEAYPNNKVMVFDQNNQIVFEQANYQNSWQGRNASGELLAPGTYYYRISFEDSEKVLMGSLVVIGE